MSSVPILQHEMNSAPKLKLRWMPPSLTARTNAGRLREVRDKQQTHWMGFVAEEEDREDEDDLLVDTGSSINVVRRMGGEYDMGRDDIIDDGDEVEFGENVPRLNYPLRPVVPSSSTTSAVAASGIRLTVSRPMECMYSPPTCSESPTQGTHCRSSSSSSRTFASISPVSSTSFAGSNSSLSPPSTMVPYVQHEIDITSVGGGGVYTTSTENISREYGVQDTRTEEQSPYFETGSRPYHPSSQVMSYLISLIFLPIPSSTCAWHSLSVRSPFFLASNAIENNFTYLIHFLSPLASQILSLTKLYIKKKRNVHSSFLLFFFSSFASCLVLAVAIIP